MMAPIKSHSYLPQLKTMFYNSCWCGLNSSRVFCECDLGHLKLASVTQVRSHLNQNYQKLGGELQTTSTRSLPAFIYTSDNMSHFTKYTHIFSSPRNGSFNGKHSSTNRGNIFPHSCSLRSSQQRRLSMKSSSPLVLLLLQPLTTGVAKYVV